MTPHPCPTLLPCPFCGGEARDWTYDSCDCCGKAVNGSVNCTVCGAGVTHRDSSEQATRDWNTRADLNSVIEQRLDHYKRENAALRAQIEIYKAANKDELQ